MPRAKSPLPSEHVDARGCTVEHRLRVLRRVPFFAGLSDVELWAVNMRFHEHGYQAGAVIYLAGEPATSLYVVAAGKVKLLRHAPTGRDVLLDILAPGEFFGSVADLGEEEHQETAEAHTPCCVLAISAADFQSLLQRYASITVAVLAVVTERLRAAHEAVRQLSTAPVEERVAAMLLTLAKKLGTPQREGILIQMPLSRQDLAQLTGTTTETVSRIISRFRQEGLVRSGREWVAIADVERLTEVAGGAAP